MTDAPVGHPDGDFVRAWNIGVISDTHGLLRAEALAALDGSDYIIHAGDVGNREILDKLRLIAPVTTVRGNVDVEKWAQEMPLNNVLEVDGLTFYVLHDVKQLDLNPQRAGFAAVIYGHSHKPDRQVRNGVLYFNPGSAGPRRFTLPVTVGRLGISGAKLEDEIIPLAVK